MAEWLRVDYRTVQRLREHGLIPFKQLFQQYRYPKELLREWYRSVWIPIVRDGAITITITGLSPEIVRREMVPKRKSRRKRDDPDKD